MMLHHFRWVVLYLTFASGCLHAAVLGFEVLQRAASSLSGYEEIRGRLSFEVDPAFSGNARIVDLDKAPLGTTGRVGFSSDVRILTPLAIEARNGVAWFEIPNRGGKASPAKSITGEQTELLGRPVVVAA